MHHMGLKEKKRNTDEHFPRTMPNPMMLQKPNMLTSIEESMGLMVSYGFQFVSYARVQCMGDTCKYHDVQVSFIR